MSDTPKWTPGPWEAWENDRGWQVSSRDLEDEKKHPGQRLGGFWLAHLKCDANPRDEEANAHLIAAAPTMAEVLDEAPILSQYHGKNGFEVERFAADYETWIGRRRAALSKARGESE